VTVRHTFPFLLSWILCALPAVALAGGFEFPTNGTVALGRGGAYTARADDLVSIELNPAGLLKVKGIQAYLGNNVSMNHVEFSGFYTDGSQAPAVSDQSGPMWVAPFVALSSDFGLKNFSFGLAVYGPSANGLSHYPVTIDPAALEEATKTSYPHCADLDQKHCPPHYYMLLDKNVLLAYYSVSAAYGRRDKWGVGITMSWVDLLSARFSMMVNGWFQPNAFDENDAGKTYPGYDVEADIKVSDHIGYAFTLGGWWRPLEFVEVGASFRGPVVNFEADGTTRLTFQSPTMANISSGEEGLKAFDANGRMTDSIPTRFDFSYPMTGRLGARYFHEVGPEGSRRELFDVELDVVWEGWSALESYDVTLDGYMMMVGSGMQAPEKLEFKKDDDRKVSLPKEYEDTWSLRLGGQVSPLEWLTVHAGAYVETGAVPERNTNLDFTSFDRLGASGGLSFNWRTFRLSVAYSHIFQADRTVSPEETAVYKQYPVQTGSTDVDWVKVGAGTYSTSYDVLSAALSAGF